MDVGVDHDARLGFFRGDVVGDLQRPDGPAQGRGADLDFLGQRREVRREIRQQGGDGFFVVVAVGDVDRAKPRFGRRGAELGQDLLVAAHGAKGLDGGGEHPVDGGDLLGRADEDGERHAFETGAFVEQFAGQAPADDVAAGADLFGNGGIGGKVDGRGFRLRGGENGRRKQGHEQGDQDGRLQKFHGRTVRRAIGIVKAGKMKRR